jgi:hypothetical protein
MSMDNCFLDEAGVALPEKYHRHAGVVVQMLLNRGYVLPPPPPPPPSADGVLQQQQQPPGRLDMQEIMLRSALQHSYIDAWGARFGRMRVVFCSLRTQELLASGAGGGMGIHTVDALVEMAERFAVKHLMLIVDHELTQAARAEFNDMTDELQWERFLYGEVSYNVVEHIDFPRVRPLTDVESCQLLAQHKPSLCGFAGKPIPPQQDVYLPNLPDTMRCTHRSCYCQPRMFQDGVMARYFFLRHGDMVRIDADSTLSGEAVRYRTVISRQHAGTRFLQPQPTTKSTSAETVHMDVSSAAAAL